MEASKIDGSDSVSATLWTAHGPTREKPYIGRAGMAENDGGNGAGINPAIYRPAISLVRASIELAQIAVTDENDRQALSKALDKVRRAFNKSITVFNRQEDI